MCWRSLASEGFSLETYSVLFTSPLYTKVMLTTVRTAAIATIFALLWPIRSPTRSRSAVASCAG